MIRQTFSALAVATGFFITDAPAALPENNTAALSGTMPDISKIITGAAIAPQRPADNCSAQILSYYDDASLEAMNKTLGALEKWAKTWGFLDPIGGFKDESYPEEIFGEDHLSENEQVLYEMFSAPFALEYEAGTDKGLEFLKVSPFNVRAAVTGYSEFAAAIYQMADPVKAQDIKDTFYQTIENYYLAVSKTQFLMDEQYSAGCNVPAGYKPGLAPH